MEIRRGPWKPATTNKVATVKSSRFGARPATVLSPGVSNSEHHLANRQADTGAIPEKVSEFRQAEIIRATGSSNNQIKESPAPLLLYSNSFKKSQEIKENFLRKSAASVTSGGYSSAGGGTTIQAPEIYSPLFQIANLQLPRERITMNAWNRNFYDTHPLVHNCINLHATYPINKINIKCKDGKIEQFFKDMAENIDLIGVLQGMALEIFKIGECFPYAELDERTGAWKSIVIQNPDYIHIKTSVLGGDPVISLSPDAALKRLVQSNNPADIQLRSQIDDEILYHIRKGNNIPLDNFHISHLALKSAPYDVHGTSPIVTVYKDLMLYDKLRECYSSDTEVLTDSGFMNGLELSLKYKNSNQSDLPSIACFNSETEMVEHHKPIKTHISEYNGNMYRFKGKKVDILVTPEHRMWVNKNKKTGWSGWHFEQAKDVSPSYWYKFRCHAKYNEGEKVEFIDVLGKKIPSELYMKVLGHIISEGCVYQSYKNGRYDNNVSICQNIESKYQQNMRNNFKQFAELLGKNLVENTKVVGSGFSAHSPKNKWEALVSGKDLVNYFKKEIGTNDVCNSGTKRIPRWIFGLHSDLLKCLLESLMEGDGHFSSSLYNTTSKGFRYDTGSKQLADDVYELVYRLGFVPLLRTVDRTGENTGKNLLEYSVSWSNTHYGREPRVYGKSDSKHHGAHIGQTDYDGLVWCFEVPTGLFITRRNGKITIQGNSKYAQADSLVNPITLIKVGGAGEGEYKATGDDLEKWRQIMECHDEETEVLTDHGFKKFFDAIDYTRSDDVAVYTASPKTGIKIACFNNDTKQLEYHIPSRATLYDYSGEMYHFSGGKLDIKVTPNHRMLVTRKLKKGWSNSEIITAENLSLGTHYRFRSVAKFNGEEKESINVCGKSIKTDDYLEFLGNVISEGYVCKINDKYYNSITLYQENCSPEKNSMETNLEKIANCFGKTIQSKTIDNSHTPFSGTNTSTMWRGILCSSVLTKHLFEEIGENGKCNSHNKRIPRWIYSLSTRQMKILINSLVAGDGTKYTSKTGKSGFKYSTISENLAKDLHELVFLAGFAPKVYKTKNGQGKDYWLVTWTESGKGSFPHFGGVSNKREQQLTKEQYNGKVWCFTVPTGLFVTRRNGLITIQGNSAEYDKNFKIITHAGVTVERVGANGSILDINPDMQAILDNILYGLMVPKAVVTQEGSSFNSATVGLEVLRQRYEAFRNMMSQWLIKKIFAPISEIQEFYEYKDGDKKLIVPDIEWNRMILFDMDNYISVLNGLVKEKAVSKTTLFRSLGLNIDEENRLRKEELIKEAIIGKETAILNSMTLGALRSLKAEDDIIEPTDQVSLPGTPGSEESGIPGMTPPGAGGLGGGGLGGSPMPPMGGLGGGLGELPTEGLGGPEAPAGGGETPQSPTPAPTSPTQ